jgi:hypothetical protein
MESNFIRQEIEMGKRTLQLLKPLKEFLCQHIIGMEIKLKFCTSPSTKDMSLGEERKRG